MTDVDPTTAPIARLRSLADRLLAIDADLRRSGIYALSSIAPEAADGLRDLAAIKFEAWSRDNPESPRYVPPKRWRGD